MLDINNFSIFPSVQIKFSCEVGWIFLGPKELTVKYLVAQCHSFYFINLLYLHSYIHSSFQLQNTFIPRVQQCLPPRRNWVPHPLSRKWLSTPPPWTKGGGNTLACGRGGGEVPIPTTVPEFIDPVFAKTSPKRSFWVIENEGFGLVFAKTGSTNSGTG